MKLTKTLLAAGLSIGLLTGCALDRSAIITVNGEAITKAQYEKNIKRAAKKPAISEYAS